MYWESFLPLTVHFEIAPTESHSITHNFMYIFFFELRGRTFQIRKLTAFRKNYLILSSLWLTSFITFGPRFDIERFGGMGGLRHVGVVASPSRKLDTSP